MSRTGCKRESRYKVFEVVSATVAGAERRAHMINVSLSGALLHMDQSARLGEPVALHWEGRAIAGQIVWASPPALGCASSIHYLWRRWQLFYGIPKFRKKSHWSKGLRRETADRVNPIFSLACDCGTMPAGGHLEARGIGAALRRAFASVRLIPCPQTEDAAATITSSTGYFDALRSPNATGGNADGVGRLFMAIAEIERFATLRETIGYVLADRLLTIVGDRLLRALTDCEIGRTERTRIEFAFRARSHDAARAQLIAATAATAERISLDGLEFDLHLVIGAADAGDGPILSHVVDRAEFALIEAQRRHLRLFLADPTTSEASDARRALARDLQHAAARGQLELLYQPKVRNRSWTIDAAEALLRWHHPEHGAVPPALFIPLAEEIGCIRSITEWVIERALEDQRKLRATGCDILIDVNLSGLLVTDLDFIAWVLDRLRSSHPPLGFEITETATIADQERALANLNALVDAGARIAIDDYGAGFSSLAYLQRLPLTELKIDKSFITSLASNHRDPLLVRSTIDLAHAMELEVTAEGVDTPEAMALLRVMGCDLLQGFLISRPLSIDSLRTFVRDREHDKVLSLLPGVGRKLREQAASAQSRSAALP